MAKSKEERILDQFLNEERKRAYRNRNKDPMEMALAEQRAAHTINYEQPVEQENDGSTLSWEDAERMYQESLKDKPVVEENVVEPAVKEQGKEENISENDVEQSQKEDDVVTREIPGRGSIQEEFNEDGTRNLVYRDENGRMFCFETEKGLHFYARDNEGNDLGTISYYDGEFSSAKMVMPDGHEVELQATEDHQIDASNLDEAEIANWNALNSKFASLSEQRNDLVNEWSSMVAEQQKESALEQEPEFVVEAVEPLVEEPVVENVVEPVVEEPVVENVVEPVVEEPVAEDVIDHPEEEHGYDIPRPAPQPQPILEDEGNVGSFGESEEPDDEHEQEGPEEDGPENGPEDEVLVGTYLGGPEKLQRWLKTYAIEGSLSQPQVASPFAGINSVNDVDGYSCKSVTLETGNRMFVGSHRIDFSNGEKKAPTLEEALTMVRMGQMNGWTSCRLNGSPELNKQLFVACKILGMPIKDFVPTEEMLKEANAMQTAYNPAGASPEQRLINRVADLDQRFDKVDSYAGNEMPSFDSVRAAHADGYGPFGTTIVSEEQHSSEETHSEDVEEEQYQSEDDERDTYDGDEVENEPEEDTPTFTREEINEMDLTPVDGKYDAEQVQAVTQLYDQYHDQANTQLSELASEQFSEETRIRCQMSEYTHKVWDTVEQKQAEGKPLTADDEKLLASKNAYVEYCKENDEDATDSYSMVPKKFWPDRAQKVAENQKHKIALKYMYATEATKSGLVSLMGMAVKTPEKLQEQDYQIDKRFPDEEFSALPVSEQLKQIGKMRSNTAKKEADIQKTFGKMTDGKQLTSVSGKYQSGWAQDSDQQFDDRVKKNFFGKYAFRDEGR